jgi:hypothetical protein
MQYSFKIPDRLLLDICVWPMCAVEREGDNVFLRKNWFMFLHRSDNMMFISKLLIASIFSESQYSGSKHHGILGWPLIHSLRGLHTSTSLEERQPKDWACLAPSIDVACFTIRNAVLLHKQLIRPVTNLACSICRSAARSYVQNLQVLQSKCLRIATNTPCYKSTRIWGLHFSPTTSEH